MSQVGDLGEFLKISEDVWDGLIGLCLIGVMVLEDLYGFALQVIRYASLFDEMGWML